MNLKAIFKKNLSKSEYVHDLHYLKELQDLENVCFKEDRFQPYQKLQQYLKICIILSILHGGIKNTQFSLVWLKNKL